MVDIEEQKIFERADKITERLFKALYDEAEGDTIDYITCLRVWTSAGA